MTDNENQLLPCPLCGSEVTAIETHPGRGGLYCGECDLVLGGNEAMTPEELTEKWNTRTATGPGFSRAVHDGNLWVRVVKPTWSEADKYRCECGERLRGLVRRCPSCGGWVDYGGVGPRAVLDGEVTA